MPLNDSTNSADLKVIATAGVTFRLFDFVTQNLLLVPFFLCSSSDSLVLWFFWFLWFSWFSGSCGSLVLLVLVVPWFLWFPGSSGSRGSCGSRGSMVLVLVLCVWLPCSTCSQIFSDGTTYGNLGVRDGMRATSERMVWRQIEDIMDSHSLQGG